MSEKVVQDNVRVEASNGPQQPAADDVFSHLAQQSERSNMEDAR
jgi:hypothetical protein